MSEIKPTNTVPTKIDSSYVVTSWPAGFGGLYTPTIEQRMRYLAELALRKHFDETGKTPIPNWVIEAMKAAYESGEQDGRENIRKQLRAIIGV